MKFPDLIDFCLEHRKNKIFEGWNEHQVAFCLANALADGCLAYALAGDGKVEGVGVVKPDHEQKTLRITHLLTIKSGAIAKLLTWYHCRWRDYTLVAKRRGKELVYKDTPRFISKLERLT